MADNNHDPAGSTQMFRAFVDEGSTTARSAGGSSSRGPGLMVAAVVAALVVVVGVVWLALT